MDLGGRGGEGREGEKRDMIEEVVGKCDSWRFSFPRLYSLFDITAILILVKEEGRGGRGGPCDL